MSESAFELMPQSLAPQSLAATIPPLYGQQDGEDKILHAKFFTPWGKWTWYVAEYSETAPDGYPRLCYGLVFGDEAEWGYFSLNELEGIRGPVGLRIERDLWWKPTPASQVIRERVR